MIMGTPKYSIPTGLYHEHPEILARPLGGSPVFYGMHQNTDTDNATFRLYTQRLIKNLIQHYRDRLEVVEWQIDNETAS